MSIYQSFHVGEADQRERRDLHLPWTLIKLNEERFGTLRAFKAIYSSTLGSDLHFSLALTCTLRYDLYFFLYFFTFIFKKILIVRSQSIIIRFNGQYNLKKKKNIKKKKNVAWGNTLPVLCGSSSIFTKWVMVLFFNFYLTGSGSLSFSKSLVIIYKMLDISFISPSSNFR